MSDQKAGLGDRVKDRVSGYMGVVVSLHRFLQGCDRLGVQPPVGDDGKLPEAQTFDSPDLLVVDEKVITYREQNDERNTGSITLGDKVRDPVTGFEGVAVARHVYLTGCNRITIQPPVEDGSSELPSTNALDAPLLVVVESQYVEYKEPTVGQKPPGGPPKYMPEEKNDGHR